MIIISAASLVLSINDLFYLRKIELGIPVSDAANNFFVAKGKIQYWITTGAYLTFTVSFLIWFYQAYKTVYRRASSEAPYKPGFVPFSFLVPIFNLFAPYQIMRFIWWGNASTSEELSSGFKAINLWWFISVMNVIISRVAALVYGKAEHAGEFMRGTYFYIFLYILTIHFLCLTYKLVVSVGKAQNYQWQ